MKYKLIIFPLKRYCLKRSEVLKNASRLTGRDQFVRTCL